MTISKRTACMLQGKIFESCAVVGSSGSLLAIALGEQINAHQQVLRFNNAVTKVRVPSAESSAALCRPESSHVLCLQL